MTTQTAAHHDTKFKKGQKSGPGRPKGAQNKLSKELKDMILTALDGVGGVKYLEAKAESHPQAFMALVGKVLPMTVAGDPNAPLGITVNIKQF